LFVTVGIAISMAYLAHVAYWLLDTPNAVLRIVWELGVLVIAVRQAPATSSTRHRVLKMLLALFVISALGDTVLFGLAFLPETLPWQGKSVLGYVVVLVQVVGAVNCVRYGLAVKWYWGVAWTLGYVVVVIVLFGISSQILGGVMF
jgi:predicted membrane protein